MGITLKLSKSTFAMARIKWFGRTFNSNGVTVDNDKVNSIIEEGRPRDLEDVRSLLMACQYNAKFAFDNDIQGSYEDITLPLRKLLRRDAVFRWEAKVEEAYNKLINIISNPATLHTFSKDSKTHFVGIQASLYQEIPTNRHQKRTWIPIDHVSRALTPTETRYSPIERESLGLAWGMEQFRYYIVGSKFIAWTDHQPLSTIYNNQQKLTSKRIGKHRNLVQDLDFSLSYLRGRHMPCDYGSRHPNPIHHLPADEQDQLGFDNGKDIYVRKIIDM